MGSLPLTRVVDMESEAPPRSTTRRVVAVLLAVISVCVIVCATVLLMNDKELPDLLLGIGTAAVGAIAALVAGVSDGN